MAPGVTASSAVEVDAATGPRDHPRHGRATDADESIVPAARRRAIWRRPSGDILNRCSMPRSGMCCGAITRTASVRDRWTRRDSVKQARGERVPIAIRLGRRRTPSAVGFIERRASLPPDREGVAISTFGKVIKRGWEWLGLAPAVHGRISGLIEAPDLAACLTLSKNDFIRSGARGAAYLAYRKAVQEAVSRQLSEWGDGHDAEARPRMVRLERDLERVLEDLADDFPLLRALVDRRAGGQKRLPMPGRGDERVPASLFATLATGHESTGADAEPAVGLS